MYKLILISFLLCGCTYTQPLQPATHDLRFENSALAIQLCVSGIARNEIDHGTPERFNLAKAYQLCYARLYEMQRNHKPDRKDI